MDEINDIGTVRMEIPPEGGKVVVHLEKPGEIWSWELTGPDALWIGKALMHCAEMAEKQKLTGKGPITEYRLATGVLQ